jgi:hypothetical protein
LSYAQGVWSALAVAPLSRFVVLAVLVVGTPALALAYRGMAQASGEIVLSDWPLCETFVLQGEYGYAVVSWRSGTWVFSRGDQVYGRFDTLGPTALAAIGRVTVGRMVVAVEVLSEDLDQAERTFRSRCGPVSEEAAT